MSEEFRSVKTFMDDFRKLQAENEALRKERDEWERVAYELSKDNELLMGEACLDEDKIEVLEKELAIKNDALTAALLTSEHLNKELTELKGRSCEECSHFKYQECQEKIVQAIDSLEYTPSLPEGFYCSLWEKRK